MGFWSPQDLNFRKIDHFRNFEKQPIQSDFFDFFGLIMHFHAIKSSILTKNGQIFGKSSQFLKKLGACGAKNWSLQPIFPIFRRLWCRKIGHFRPKMPSQKGSWPPPIRTLKCIYHEKFYQNIRVQYVNPSTFRRSICTYACNVLRAVYESEPVLCVQSLKTFTAHLSIFVCICTPGKNFPSRYFILF